MFKFCACKREMRRRYELILQRSRRRRRRRRPNKLSKRSQKSINRAGRRVPLFASLSRLNISFAERPVHNVNRHSHPWPPVCCRRPADIDELSAASWPPMMDGSWAARVSHYGLLIERLRPTAEATEADCHARNPTRRWLRFRAGRPATSLIFYCSRPASNNGQVVCRRSFWRANTGLSSVGRTRTSARSGAP